MRESLSASPKNYELSGGAQCQVYRSDTNQTLPYLAKVTLDGRYPATNNIAHNINRVEEILAVSGRFRVTIDGAEHALEENQSVIVRNGQRYSLEGCGELLVLVLDGHKAESKIEACLVGTQQ